MGEFDRFARELRRFLRGKTITAQQFIQETAQQYCEIVARNDQDRDTWLQNRLVEVTSLKGINALSNILKKHRIGQLVKSDIAYGLYFLAKVDDDYRTVVQPIERVLFKGTKLKPITFKDKIGWEPTKLRSRENSAQDGSLQPSFPNVIALDASYQRGRKEFGQTKDSFLKNDTKSVALTTAVYGAGGYGKSSLAQELCGDIGIAANFTGGIYWLQFGLSDSRDESAGVVRLAQAIDRMLERQYPKEQRPTLALENNDNDVLALLEVLPKLPILLVADDLWTPGQSNWVSRVPDNVSVLMTTRRKSVASKAAEEIPIERLTDQAAFNLLTHGMSKLLPNQQARLRKLAKGFKGWPLLLNLANGVFKQRYNTSDKAIDRSISQYEKFLSADEIDRWDIRESGEGEFEKRCKLVGYCIEVGLNAIHPSNRPELLRQLAVFSDDIDIPFSVISDLWRQSDNETIGPIAAESMLWHFNDFSFFASFDEEAETVRLHDEILAYFRSWNNTHGKLKGLHEKLLASFKRHCTDGWDTLPKDHLYGWTYVLYHLETVGRKDEADDLRTNFEWLKAKLHAVGANELQRSFVPLSLRSDTRDVGRAIQLSMPVLVKRPNALALQLYGRLGHNLTSRIELLVNCAIADACFWPRSNIPHLSPLGAETLRLNGHDGGIISAVFSLGGAQVLTTSWLGSVQIWDATTGQELLFLERCSSAREGAVISPDGAQFLVVSEDGIAQIWDAKTGKEISQLENNSGWIQSAEFSPNGRQVLTTSEDGNTQIWDAKAGIKLLSLESDSGQSNSVSRPAFSPDGAQVLTAAKNGTAQVWDAKTGQKAPPLKGHSEIVSSAQFSPDGKQVLTASEDETARIWDAKTGQVLLSLKHGNNWRPTAVYSSDGAQVLTTTKFGPAREWDAITGNELFSLVGPCNSNNLVEFSTKSDKLLTRAKQNGILLSDAKTGKILLSLVGHSKPINSVVFSPNGKKLLTASDDGTARLWDATTTQVFQVRKGHSGLVTDIMFSPDGNLVLTASIDGTARIWDTVTGQELLSISHGENWDPNAVFSPDGNLLLTTSWDGTVLIWDAKTGKKLVSLDGHRKRVTSAVFSPNGSLILTASVDGTARIWSASTGIELLLFSNHLDQMINMVFSPDGNLRLTALDETEVVMKDARTGQKFHYQKLNFEQVSSAVFSLDGHQVLSAAGDGTARIWDAKTGHELHSFTGHSGPVNSAMFSSNGKQVLTTSDDDTARIWDAANGKEQQLLKGVNDEMSRAVFSPDGKQVLTAYLKSTAQIWDTTVGKEQIYLKGHSSYIRHFKFSPDGKEVLTSADDNTARIWDAKTGRQLAIVDFDFPVSALSCIEDKFVAALDNGQVCIFRR